MLGVRTSGGTSGVPRVSGPVPSFSPYSQNNISLGAQRGNASLAPRPPTRSESRAGGGAGGDGGAGPRTARPPRPSTAAVDGSSHHGAGGAGGGGNSPEGRHHPDQQRAASARAGRKEWDARFGSTVALLVPPWAVVGEKASTFREAVGEARLEEQQRGRGRSRGRSASSARPRSRSAGNLSHLSPQSIHGNHRGPHGSSSTSFIYLDDNDPLWSAVAKRDVDAMESAVDYALHGASAEYLELAATFLEAVLEGKQDDFLNDFAGAEDRGPTLYKEGPAFAAWKKHKQLQKQLELERQRLASKREELRRRQLMYDTPEINKIREQKWQNLPIPPSRR